MSKTLAKSTLVFSSMTFISRILGFVRDMLVAHIFGATGMTDAFFVAYKIPNFMRRLFAEGAFSQAFVPMLAEYKTQRSQAEIQRFVDHIAGTLGVILTLVTIVGVLAAPILIHLFSPGFVNDPSRYSLTVDMLRITFPYILFISLTAFAGGILNTHRRFAAPAFTPVLLNVSMIGFAVFVAPHCSEPIEALAWGVFVGGVIQLAFQYPFLRRIRLVPVLRWGWRDTGVQRVLKLMVPALFGVSVAQIGLLIDTVFASFLVAGSISWLYNSERLMLFPLGVFGVALSTVVLPHLAKKFASQSQQAYAETLQWAIRVVLLIGIPAALGLMLLAKPLLTTLFHYGQFTVHDVRMTSQSLLAYALGVPFMMMVKILASGFYAQQNIKTPVKIAAFALLVNILLNVALIFPLRHAGLALASALAAMVNAGLLFFWLRKSQVLPLGQGWWVFFLRLLIANGCMVMVLYVSCANFSQWLQWSGGQRGLHLLLLLVIAMVVYAAGLRLTGLKLRDLRSPG